MQWRWVGRRCRARGWHAGRSGDLGRLGAISRSRSGGAVERACQPDAVLVTMKIRDLPGSEPHLCSGPGGLCLLHLVW